MYVFIFIFFLGILFYFNLFVKEDLSLLVVVVVIKILLYFLENNKSKLNVKK